MCNWSVFAVHRSIGLFYLQRFNENLLRQSYSWIPFNNQRFVRHQVYEVNWMHLQERKIIKNASPLGSTKVYFEIKDVPGDLLMVLGLQESVKEIPQIPYYSELINWFINNIKCQKCANGKFGKSKHLRTSRPFTSFVVSGFLSAFLYHIP